MKNYSAQIKGYKGDNPFGDYQGRNFSDDKVCSEFCPTSKFWSLFNDQHEIILGSRGSGKTFLLKMMRYSMLKNFENVRAKKIVKDKHFISLYVPMHLEFIASYITSNLDSNQQIELFKVAFNCLLAQSLLYEVQAIIHNEFDNDQMVMKNIMLSQQINDLWFDDSKLSSCDLSEISSKVNKVFYNIDSKSLLENKFIPNVFKTHICSPLLVVKDVIELCLGFSSPTWIVCIDEAEFLNNTLLRCINSFFRSDSNRIAFKVATLPFYHNTLETLREGITVSEGNDFNYRIIDMDYNSNDYITLTDNICFQRLSQKIEGLPSDKTLESFLGKVGNDDYIDYYRLQVGEEKSTYDYIESDIIENFSYKKNKGSKLYANKRKAIYDKYAPIYFIREMYKISQKGNSIPSWYCGAKTIRKVSQGNPRLFIHIMNDLFEKAQNGKLTPKVQHAVVYSFSQKICNSTLALESYGPVIYSALNCISEILHNNIHDRTLITGSSSFILKYNSSAEFEENRRWIELAIAHSRLIVDDDVKKGNLFPNTRLCLANIYSVKYWLPMRQDTPCKINISDVSKENTYVVKTKVKKNSDFEQLKFF